MSSGSANNTDRCFSQRVARDRHDKDSKNEPPRVGRRDGYLHHARRGTGMVRVSESHSSQLERIDADYRALFGDIVRRHGLPPDSEWRSLPYFSGEVGVHAYYADVVVVAQPRPDGRTDRAPGLAESLILTSGRPIIVFPSVSTGS